MVRWTPAQYREYMLDLIQDLMWEKGGCVTNGEMDQIIDYAYRSVIIEELVDTGRLVRDKDRVRLTKKGLGAAANYHLNRNDYLL